MAERVYRIQVRLDEYERNMLNNLCVQNGLSKTEMIVRALLYVQNYGFEHEFDPEMGVFE